VFIRLYPTEPYKSIQYRDTDSFTAIYPNLRLQAEIRTRDLPYMLPNTIAAFGTTVPVIQAYLYSSFHNREFYWFVLQQNKQKVLCSLKIHHS
jgi:hypothetical protein